MTTSSIWVNGQEQSTLDLPDRGVEFGDGLFETLLSHQGSPLYLDEHIARLHRGFSILGFTLPTSLVIERILQACEQYAACDWASVRVTITRGAGDRGYAPPSTPAPNIVVRASDREMDCGVLSAAETVLVRDVLLGSQPALAGIKHLNRLEQVLAAQEVSLARCDEGVMKNSAGEVVSVVAGNIFVVHAGVISTPPAEHCAVIGTRRALVINQWAPRVGVPVQERTLSLPDLETADEVFYSNALFGLRAISTLGELSWTNWPLTRELFSAYQEDFR